MSLTGSSTLWVAAMLAIALPVLTAVYWRRLGGRTPAGVGTRVLLVVLCQLMAVVAAGLALNDYAYFYGSWRELLGQTPKGQISQVVAGATGPVRGSTISPTRFAGAPAPIPQSRWSRLGRFDQVVVHGAISGLSEDALVYLPPEYFQRSWSHRVFPAALLMTGYPSTNHAVSRLVHYATVERREIRLGHSKPMVLVLMTPNPAFPRDTECTDVPGGPQALTFFAQDVPQAVASSLRVRHAGWGVGGDSTGGYCATKLAMTYPALFPVAVSLSGYYRVLHDQTTGDLWGGSTLIKQLNSPEWRLTHLQPPPIEILVTSGTGETGRLGISDAHRFLALVRSPMQADRMFVPGGAHNFATWGQEIPQAVTWLSSHLARLPGYG